MASGSEHLAPGLHDYLVGHSTPPDALLRDLIAETAERFPGRVIYQIGPEQGTFMTMLAGLMGARHAIEIGTFTGYSSICLARGMPADGELICCDINEEWTSLARAYWQKAGLADRIELRLGPALDKAVQRARARRRPGGGGDAPGWRRAHRGPQEVSRAGWPGPAVPGKA
jgi:caffeoyl-CoA O-methyltransferase